MKFRSLLFVAAAMLLTALGGCVAPTPTTQPTDPLAGARANIAAATAIVNDAELAQQFYVAFGNPSPAEIASFAIGDKAAKAAIAQAQADVDAGKQPGIDVVAAVLNAILTPAQPAVAYRQEHAGKFAAFRATLKR